MTRWLRPRPVVATSVHFVWSGGAAWSAGNVMIALLLADENPSEAGTATEPASTAVADGSFPWWFIVLGLAAVGLGALLAFRPISMPRRSRRPEGDLGA